MRILRVCLAVAALAATGGCLGDGGSVMLTFGQEMNVSPTLTAFNATNGTANTDSEGLIHFTATSAQGTLTMLVLGPTLTPGTPVDLGQEHNVLSFDVSGAGWSNNGGMLAVDGVSPYRVRFLDVPMLKGSGSAMGSFVLTGSGTFK
jgi:hypothetical protein